MDNFHTFSIEDFLPKYPNIEKYQPIEQPLVASRERSSLLIDGETSKTSILNPYTKNFYQNIYNKKEFNELKLNREEEEKIQNTGDLFKHQKIVARFLSSYTPYNALFLFHDMGTGKCILPNSKIIISTLNYTKLFDSKRISSTQYPQLQSSKMTIYDAFSNYANLFSQIKDSENGYWYVPLETIYTTSYNEYTGKFCNGVITHFYREKIQQPMIHITLETGDVLKMTSKHRLLTNNGWSNDFQNIAYVATYKNNIVNAESFTAREDKHNFITFAKPNYNNVIEMGKCPNINSDLFLVNKKLDLESIKRYCEKMNKYEALGNVISEMTPNPTSSELSFVKVKNIHVEMYTGWVYDLEVNTYNNYVAENMVTHNTCSAFGTTERIRHEQLDAHKNVFNDEEDTNTDSKGKKLITQNNINHIKGVIVITRGKNLLRNLLNELVFVCSSEGKYIPENFDNLTELERVQRIKKMTSDYYHFYTFYGFAKLLKNMSDETIRKRFSHYFIIIDEVHNISVKEDEKEDVKNTYSEIHRFLHNISSSKILLLSGTPMRDLPNEISELLNLILPEDKQMPIGKKFNEEFLIKKNDIYTFRNNKKEVFKSYIKGIFSYLSTKNSRVKKQYMGDIYVNTDMVSNIDIPQISTFTLYKCEMSRFQSKVYLSALELDNKKKGIYTNSRQATLFVAPDENYGSKFFNGKYKANIVCASQQSCSKANIDIKASDGNVINIQIENPGVIYGKRMILPDMIKKYLGSGTTEERLSNLKNLSSSYYFVIKNIIENEGRNSIAYCSFVKGSGAILFSLLLSYFGFSAAVGNESTPGNRYGIFTNVTTSTRKMERVLSRFNRKDNMTGKYIRVIIFSKVASEGLSFKNVRDIYVLTPFWNYADISQAIARGIRIGSHNDLIENGIDPDIRIYQICSIPRKEKGYDKDQTTSLTEEQFQKSIDYIMYYTSAVKDISIKSVERLLKEASIDCALTYDVNYKPEAGDYSRECDYQMCKYSCAGINPSTLNQIENIDYSTYNLYYSDDNVYKLEEKIQDFIGKKFKYILEEFRDIIPYKTTASKSAFYTLFSALNNIIDRNIPTYNKLGFISYLRNHRNMFYLDRLNNINSSTPSDVYYVKNNIEGGVQNFNSIFNVLEENSIPIMIDQLYKLVKSYNKTPKQGMKAKIDKRVDSILEILPIYIKEMLIEYAIIARNRGGNKNPFLEKILSYFSHFIEKVNGKDVSTLLYKRDDILMCLNEGEEVFTECDAETKDIFLGNITAKKEELKENIYGYYGRYDPIKNVMHIVDMVKQKESLEQNSTDKRRIYKGKSCVFYDKIDLMKIIMKVGLEYPDNFWKNTPYNIKKDKNSLLPGDIIDKFNITKFSIAKTYFQGEGISLQGNTKDGNKFSVKPSIDSLLRAFYYAPIQKKLLCSSLTEWFKNNGLLEIDKNVK